MIETHKTITVKLKKDIHLGFKMMLIKYDLKPAEFFSEVCRRFAEEDPKLTRIVEEYTYRRAKKVLDVEKDKLSYALDQNIMYDLISTKKEVIIDEKTINLDDSSVDKK